MRVASAIRDRSGFIKAYAIGGGIAATYYIEPVLTYDLDIFFIPAKEWKARPSTGLCWRGSLRRTA
jgi:hypothetical protein